MGIDEPLEVYEGGKSYYYHADGLGSIVALTKSTGTAANTYFGYNTFGGMPSPSETVANPFRFTARDFDSETGLYYYRARYYDPVFGRFLSEDPIGFDGEGNFYPYVGSSPTGFVDPYGLVKITYNVGYYPPTGFDYQHAGTTTLGEPTLSADCECTGNGKYKLNIKIVFPIHVVYDTESTLGNEKKHVRVAQEYLTNQRATYERYEQTYDSKVECEYRKTLFVTGIPTSGRVPDLMRQIENDVRSDALRDAQRAVDNWLDVLLGR